MYKMSTSSGPVKIGLIYNEMKPKDIPDFEITGAPFLKLYVKNIYVMKFGFCDCENINKNKYCKHMFISIRLKDDSSIEGFLYKNAHIAENKKYVVIFNLDHWRKEDDINFTKKKVFCVSIKYDILNSMKNRVNVKYDRLFN